MNCLDCCKDKYKAPKNYLASWNDVKIGEKLYFKPQNKTHTIIKIEQPKHWTNKQCFLIIYEEDGQVKTHTPGIWNYERKSS